MEPPARDTSGFRTSPEDDEQRMTTTRTPAAGPSILTEADRWIPRQYDTQSDKRIATPDGKRTAKGNDMRYDTHQTGVLGALTAENRAAVVPEEYRRYDKIFQTELETGLPKHQPWDHEIVLREGTTPRFFPIYPLNANQLQTLREYLDENLRKGYIRPSTSPAGYPLFFVPKKNGKQRPVIDYRQLNDITIKNRYPLPLISELRDRLQGAQWFTKLDLLGAYNLVRIKEGDEWKTAFRTRYGHYEYLVMPFGLTNAPATFQALINDVLRDFLDDFVVVYLDDILVFSASLEDNRDHVHKVLQRLQDADLLVAVDKSEFHVQEVEFLGHRIRPGEVRMEQSKVQAVRDWPTPTTVKEVRAFLGFANYYRRMIQGFAHDAGPLTDLTRKDAPWRWTAKEEAAFQTIRDKILKEPVIMLPDPEKPFEVETDASDYALGAQLGQRDDNGILHPVAFMSKKLHGPELNYQIHDKELMAIIEALKEWRPYLSGARHQVQVYTDHKNLTYFATRQQLNQRQTRWVEFLSEFDIKINYIKGKENARADALSRRPDHDQEVPAETQAVFTTNKDGTLENTRTVQAAYRVTQDDKDLRQAQQDDPANQEDTRISQHAGWTLYNGKLYVPEALREQIVRDIHEAPVGGHQGVSKTYERLQRLYDFPRARQTVRDIIRRRQRSHREESPGEARQDDAPAASQFEQSGISVGEREIAVRSTNLESVLRADVLAFKTRQDMVTGLYSTHQKGEEKREEEAGNLKQLVLRTRPKREGASCHELTPSRHTK